MSLTGTDYRPRDHKRACDICGHMWHKSELTRIAPFRWACPDDAAGLTAEDISRHNASVRPLMVKAVKNAKGISQTPTYQQAEGRVLNAILAKAPDAIFPFESGTIGTATDSINGLDVGDRTRATGWAAVYLGNLVLEGRRPTYWITQAKAKLIVLADLIVSKQVLTGPGTPALQFPQYGVIYMGASVTALLDVQGNAACLLGLLRAYQATGNPSYIGAARNIAIFLRRAQCPGLWAGQYAQYTAGNRIPPGPFPDLISLTFGVGIPTPGSTNGDHFAFPISGLICAWALNELLKIDGDATYGGSAGAWTSDPSSTLSAAVSACVSWWANGARDSTGAIVIGFGPDTPKQSYQGGSNGNIANAFWVASTATDGSLPVSGYEYAAGVRALYEVGGLTSQVTSLHSWLRGFSADAGNAVPSAWTHEKAIKSTLGTYDPILALARLLRVRTASGVTVATESAFAYIDQPYLAPAYDWRTTGLLAPIQSRLASGDLRVAKDVLANIGRRRWSASLSSGQPSTTNLSTSYYVRSEVQDDLVLLNMSGLSLQTSVGLPKPEWEGVGLLFGHYVDLIGACQTADVYRYSPQAFPAAQG